MTLVLSLIQPSPVPTELQGITPDRLATLSPAEIEQLPVLQGNRRLLQKLARANPDALLAAGLHEFLDELQVELGALHAQLVATWFAADD